MMYSGKIINNPTSAETYLQKRIEVPSIWGKQHFFEKQLTKLYGEYPGTTHRSHTLNRSKTT